MAQITSTTDREPRGQTAIVCIALQAKNGLTAAKLLEKAGGVTPHNSWSLQRIADRFGFKLIIIDGSKTDDGLKRYRFEPKIARAKKPVAKKPANSNTNKKTAA
jgi:hypothetical protein